MQACIRQVIYHQYIKQGCPLIITLFTFLQLSVFFFFEDLLFLLGFIFLSPFGYLQEVLYFAMIHKTSVTKVKISLKHPSFPTTTQQPAD